MFHVFSKHNDQPVECGNTLGFAKRDDILLAQLWGKSHLVYCRWGLKCAFSRGVGFQGTWQNCVFIYPSTQQLHLRKPIQKMPQGNAQMHTYKTNHGGPCKTAGAWEHHQAYEKAAGGLLTE